MADDDNPDLTVYDLAERMAAGQPLTDAAHREVAAELLRVQRELTAIARGWHHIDEVMRAIAMPRASG